MSGQTCGQRAVVTQGNVVEYGYAGIPKDLGGYLTGPCVKPSTHGVEHQDNDGLTWIESVR